MDNAPLWASETEADAQRIPPHNLNAEQSVLGGLMLDNSAWDRIAGLVAEGDFYRREHRLIFRAIAGLADNDQPFDVVTLAEALERAGQIDAAGGLPYLGTLLGETPSSANIRAYAGIVREQSSLRALIAFGGSQVEAGYCPSGRSAAELLGAAQADLGAIAERGQRGRGFLTAKDAAREAVERIDRLYQSGGGMVGVSTGWADLDRATRGLEPGTLTVVAARPSMGKTALGVQLASHVAGSGVAVAVFSLEMSAGSLGMRLLSAFGRVDHDHIRTGQLADDEWPRLTSAGSQIAALALHIEDQSGLTVADIATKSRKLHREHGGLGLILIDYLGLIEFGARVENQNIGIGAITRRLKGLAKSLNVPVVLLAQLNRDVEKRPNKRPMMSDLRDSGSIEQDADLIAFIYRDEVYNTNSNEKGIAEIGIAKQRNGPTGVVRLAFNGAYCRFDDLASGYEAPSQSGGGDYEY